MTAMFDLYNHLVCTYHIRMCLEALHLDLWRYSPTTHSHFTAPNEPASQPWQVDFTAKMSYASGSWSKDIIIMHINLPGSVLALEGGLFSSATDVKNSAFPLYYINRRDSVLDAVCAS